MSISLLDCRITEALSICLCGAGKLSGTARKENAYAVSSIYSARKATR